MKKLSIILVALMLTACGSSSSDDPFPPNPTPPVVVTPAPTPTPTPPPATGDSFFARVLAMVMGQSETDEPIDIAAIVATTPEDTEPTPL